MDLKGKKGFTLIELVLVIAILGVLAVSAIPTFFDISLTSARTNSRDAVIGAIQAGLSLYAADQVASGSAESYPATLDALADATVASSSSRPFTNILQNGVSSQWIKADADCYAYDTDGDGTFDDGTGDIEFQYDSTAGTFVQAAGAPPNCN